MIAFSSQDDSKQFLHKTFFSKLYSEKCHKEFYAILKNYAAFENFSFILEPTRYRANPVALIPPNVTPSTRSGRIGSQRSH